MARFLCALHASSDAVPTAYALVELMSDGDEPSTDGPSYVVRDLRRLTGDDPTKEVLQTVASEPQYAAQTTFVTTGGQRAADALHEHGPSAAAVTLVGKDGPDTDAADVSLQVLVDTFERLYRDGAVTVPGSLDAASEAVDALYREADLEAAAPDSDRDASGDIDAGASTTLAGTEVPGSGPKPTVVEQSGSAANTSTERVESPITADEATAMAVDAERRQSRVAARTGAPAPDLGDARDVAVALALACWYGETTRDNLPQTDKADEALAARQKRQDRRNPQRND